MGGPDALLPRGAGAYFAMEAIVAQGGGPPPPIHRYDDETFYIFAGE